MSVEATGWAFRQKVPPKPKMLLLALADQTDEVSGHVCYGKTDIKHLAAKASCSERSFYRYMGALVRNGYALQHSGKAKGEANQYWLCLDRVAAKSIKEWRWNDDGSDVESTEDDASDDTQDVAEGLPDWQTLNGDEKASPDDQIGRGGLPQVGRHESIADHNIYRSAQERIRPSSFSKHAQDAAIENRTISKAAENGGAKVFVIENSRAWHEWAAYRRDVLRLQAHTMPTCNGPPESGGKRGWYMPSLFPPSQAPPQQGPSDQDIRDFK